MLSFKCSYAAVNLAASIALLWLLFTGPPLPVASDKFMPVLHSSPKFILFDPSYTSLANVSDAQWESLVPESGGAVLATNLTSGFHFWANLAVFHQLQCLKDIRSQFVAVAKSWDNAEAFMKHRGPGSDYDLLGHCFDYLYQVFVRPTTVSLTLNTNMNLLSQGILCHADTTLETEADLAHGVKIRDGNALWHSCRDWTILRDWAAASGKPHEVGNMHMIRDVIADDF